MNEAIDPEAACKEAVVPKKVKSTRKAHVQVRAAAMFGRLIAHGEIIVVSRTPFCGWRNAAR